MFMTLNYSWIQKQNVCIFENSFMTNSTCTTYICMYVHVYVCLRLRYVPGYFLCLCGIQNVVFDWRTCARIGHQNAFWTHKLNALFLLLAWYFKSIWTPISSRVRIMCSYHMIRGTQGQRKTKTEAADQQQIREQSPKPACTAESWRHLESEQRRATHCRFMLLLLSVKHHMVLVRFTVSNLFVSLIKFSIMAINNSNNHNKQQTQTNITSNSIISDQQKQKVRKIKWTLTVRVRVQSPNAVSETRVQSPIRMQWSGFLLIDQHVVLVITSPHLHLSLSLVYNIVCACFSTAAAKSKTLSLRTPRSNTCSLLAPFCLPFWTNVTASLSWMIGLSCALF